MSEKDYKALYEKSLAKQKKLKVQVNKLKDLIQQLESERFSCDIEPLKGELFGGDWEIVRIDGQLYVRVSLWTVDTGYDGHLVNTPPVSEKFEVFLRRDDDRKPVPYWFYSESGIHFVITRANNPRFILNPPDGQPKHLLITGQVQPWEGWYDDSVSPLQLEHDTYYLRQLAECAAEFD